MIMKNKTYVLFVLFSFFFLKSIQSQNLVVNPSFENVSTVNCNLNNNAAEFNSEISNWTAPVNTSPDIMDITINIACFSNPYGSAANTPGHQTPRTGSHMAHSIFYAANTWYRELIQINLSSALNTSKQYKVSFYVSLSDNYQYASNAFEVLFTTSEIPLQAANANLAAPQLTYSGAAITDKTNWTLIEFIFSPTQAYTHFTVGNISKNFTIVNTGSGSIAYSGYYYDDFSIIEYNPMPVEMIDFSVISKENHNELFWSTASETDNDFFSIEKSSDAQNFQIVQIIDGAGNSNQILEYNYNDYSINNETTYYRIKQTDYNGKYSYSKIVSVNNQINKNLTIEIYPNPISKQFTIDIKTDKEKMVEIKLINMLNEVVMSEKIILENNRTKKTYLRNNIPNGIYSLLIIDTKTMENIDVKKVVFIN